MANEIKLTKWEARIILGGLDGECISDADDVGEATDRLFTSVIKNKTIPEILTELDKEVLFDCVFGGRWLHNFSYDESGWCTTAQERFAARKAYETLCKKLDAVNPPGGWDYPPLDWDRYQA